MWTDLHLHTIASDGELHPVRLLERAAVCGIARLSITDHDTFAAYRWRDGAVREAACRLGVELLVGIELETTLEGREVHLLGYALDPEAPALAEHLCTVRQARSDRARGASWRSSTSCWERGRSERSSAFVEGRDMPMRPHFIRPLVAQGRFGSYGEGRRVVPRARAARTRAQARAGPRDRDGPRRGGLGRPGAPWLLLESG